MKGKLFLVPLLLTVALLLATAVAGAAPPPQAGPPDMVRVFVAFDHQPGPADEALVHAAGGKIRYTYRIVPAIAASIPQAAIDALQHNPGVARVEPVISVQAVADEYANTWGVAHIGAGSVYAAGTTGAGVDVGIIDSGIASHTDLPTSVVGHDYVRDDDTPDDENGHGTHVAGTIAAQANGVGVVGVAPGVTLHVYKVLGPDGSGYYDDIVAAVQQAVADGVRVTNNSYGSSLDPGTVVKAAFDNAYKAGVLQVAAAGNSGNKAGRGENVIYPAAYDSVVAVAATDKNDVRASFSSTGPQVELSAPGVNIMSTLMNGGYGLMSGTSMASPHVAGTAALVIAAGTADANGDGKVTNDEVRVRLRSTADPLGASQWYGYGLVDADGAAMPSTETPNDAPSVAISSPSDGASFASGASINFVATASDTEDGNLTSSLVWKSSIDGQIGTGGSVTKVLSDGNHTITAEATDSGGKTGSATITITVAPTPGGSGKVAVKAIGYATQGGKGGKLHLLVTPALVDGAGKPVANASVSIDLYLGTSVYASYSGTTGTDGTVTFKATNAPSGTYTTKVTAVNAPGLTWDGTTPENSFTKQ